MHEHLDRNQEIFANKRRYDSREQAQQAFMSYRANSPRKKGRRKTPIKHKQIPYRCEVCDGWHLARI